MRCGKPRSLERTYHGRATNETEVVIFPHGDASSRAIYGLVLWGVNAWMIAVTPGRKKREKGERGGGRAL